MRRVFSLLSVVVVLAAATPVLIQVFEDPFCSELSHNTSLSTEYCYEYTNPNSSKPIYIDLKCRRAVRHCFSVELFSSKTCEQKDLKTVQAMQCDMCSHDGQANWRCIADLMLDLWVGCKYCTNCTQHEIVPVGKCTWLGDVAIKVGKISKCNILSQFTWVNGSKCVGSGYQVETVPTGECFSIAGGGSQKVQCAPGIERRHNMRKKLDRPISSQLKHF